MILSSHFSFSQDIYTLKNDVIEIKVKKTGAELCGIKLVKTGQEFMWGADPKVWGGTSPILFPIVGILKDHTYLVDGQKYFMKGHGFFKSNPNVELSASSKNSLTFRLIYNDETLKQYPFKFEYLVTFKLEKNKLIINNEVKNLDNKDMYFSMGAHPAFKCPLEEGEKYSDYYLEFNKKETAYTYPILQPSGLLGEKTDLMMDNSQILNLNYHLFDKDALVFKNLKSNSVSLCSKISGKRVQVDFDGFPYIGFWAKPNADYVCIEPWYGVNDSVNADQNFKTKEGILKLDANKSFNAVYTISIIQ